MAKKAAANKKSTKAAPAPASPSVSAGSKKKAGVAEKKSADVAEKKSAGVAKKKTAAKKAPAKKAPASTAITEQDLAQVYAKAWVDEEFRTLLETDPTAALKQYAADNGLEWTKLVKLPAQPQTSEDQDETCIHLVSCC